MNVATTASGLAVRAARIARNAVIDLRYGGLLASVINSDYRGLDLIFDGRLQPDDVLVDVGCGGGRVINWWLHNGFGDNVIYGLEIEPEVAAKTARRLGGYPNVTIRAGDAGENLPEDATLLYLFNPFKEDDVRRFAERVSRRYSQNGVRLLYYNPKHVRCFEEGLGFTVERLDLTPDGVAPLDPLAVIALNPSSA